MEGSTPILLHVCCAPCATTPIDRLRKDYAIVGFFFNPNIYPESECLFRQHEALDYFRRLGLDHIPCDQPFEDWHREILPWCDSPEGSTRCRHCFEYRLNRTAAVAAFHGISLFTTTLTVGPNKPASVIFPVGFEAASRHGVTFLAEDFKKKDGYRTSVEKSRIEGMYRQNYCGCEFSYLERQHRERVKRQDYDPNNIE